MKHIKLFEQFVNEKVYRLTGPYAAKGIVGVLMQAFKKEIERTSHEGDPEATLAEINKVWSKWAPKDGAKIVIDRVLKVVRDEEQVAFITASLNGVWELRTDMGGDGTGGAMHFGFPADFVINIGFMDDADASKYARKLDGMTNTPLFNSAKDIEIMGAFDDAVGYNNVEIRSGEVMMIDIK
jgi:hypothetical protein